MSARVMFIDQSGEMGGGEHSLLDITTKWPSPAQVVLFSDGPFRVKLEARNIPVRIIGLKRFVSIIRRENGISAAFRLLPELLVAVWTLAHEASRHDVVYANSQKAFVLGIFAARLARKPCIWHLRDILSEAHFSPKVIRLVVGLANLMAAKVIANSQATADAFVAAGGRKSRICVVYNGFDADAWTETPASDVAALRQQLGSGKAPLIGVFSRLAQWKGQHVVLEALTRVERAHLVFVGGALFGAHDYEKRLRARAQEAGLSSRVHFLGNRDDVSRLMGSVDLAVHSPVAPEPFGRVVVEAMLAGRPVIASATGGITELIDTDDSGILVPPDDAVALALAINQLLADPGRAKSIALNGRRAAVERFSLDATVNNIRRVVSAVFDPSSAS